MRSVDPCQSISTKKLHIQYFHVLSEKEVEIRSADAVAALGQDKQPHRRSPPQRDQSPYSASPAMVISFMGAPEKQGDN